MDDLKVRRWPAVDESVWITAFAGWNDAGGAAVHAAEYLSSAFGAQTFAAIDADSYFDFTQVRPISRRSGMYRRRLEWPRNELRYAQLPDGRNLIVLLGTEPHLQWRRFCRILLSVAERTAAGIVVQLGALLTDTPHTRSTPLSGSANTPALWTRLAQTGVAESRYEGPTGIVGVSGAAYTRAGVENCSIWAAVPHYISATPNPRAALALVRSVTDVLSLDIDLSALEAEESEFTSQVDRAIAENPEARQYVMDLEISSSAPEEVDLDRPPEGEGGSLDDVQAEGLIESVEEFLRSRRPDRSAGEDESPRDIE